MCAVDRAVPLDLEEAYGCGKEAVRLALSGESGYMVTIERVSDDPYKAEFGKTELSNVAVRAKAMPENFINQRGNYVTGDLIRYMRPLVGEIPEYVKLAKHFAEKK